MDARVSTRRVDPFTVYSRPVFAYREAVGHGADFEQALGVATARFDGLVATDAALVRRQMERDKYRQAGVTKAPSRDPSREVQGR